MKIHRKVYFKSKCIRKYFRGRKTCKFNGSLREGKVSLALKETLIRPIRKKPSLAVDSIGNYRPVTNFSFLSKVVERVVADQLQAPLDETNALDPFQLGFRLHVQKRHWLHCLMAC